MCLTFIKYIQHEVVSFCPEPDRLSLNGYYNILKPCQVALVLVIKYIVLSVEDKESRMNYTFYVIVLMLYFAEIVASINLRVFFETNLNILANLKAVAVFGFALSEILQISGMFQRSESSKNIWTGLGILFVWIIFSLQFKRTRYYAAERLDKYHKRPTAILNIIYCCQKYIKVSPNSTKTNE